MKGLSDSLYHNNGDGTFTVDMTKIKAAVAQLDHDLLTLEAEGDYAGAKKMFDELGVVRPSVKKTLDSLQGIPTDIEPLFVTADELAPMAQAAPTAPTPGTAAGWRSTRSRAWCV